VRTYRLIARGEGCPHCTEGYDARVRFGAEPPTSCPHCASPVRVQIRGVNFQIKAKHRAGYQEYREDLARFPGDRQAYVNSPQQVQRLADQRRREGWELRDESWADMADTVPKGSLADGPELSDEEANRLVDEAYDEARKDLGL